MKLQKYITCLLLTLPAHGAISLVYNLRVAETTKRLEINPGLRLPFLITGTALGTFRTKYDGSTQRCGGGLLTFIYSPKNFFLRADAAVGHVSSENNGVHFSRTQTDDLLFSAGYSPRIAENRRFTYSALLGFPTHKDKSLENVQCGYAHYGLGGQMDGSFALSADHVYTLRSAARCIHFFPRKAAAHVNPTNTRRFNYGLGNLVDLFIALHRRKNDHNLEAGYNPSFFFDARICPSFDDAVEKTNYIRNSFYGLYKYRFLIRETTCMVAGALSYGFDATPKTFGNKRIITAWGSWTVNF